MSTTTPALVEDDTVVDVIAERRAQRTEWADKIRPHLDEARDHLVAAHGSIVAAGHELIAAKDALPHGLWLPLLDDLGIGQRMAQRFMAVARHPILGDASRVTDLPAAIGTLDELSRLPVRELQQAIESGDVGPSTTRAEARDLPRSSEDRASAEPPAPVFGEPPPAPAPRPAPALLLDEAPETPDDMLDRAAVRARLGCTNAQIDERLGPPDHRERRFEYRAGRWPDPNLDRWRLDRVEAVEADAARDETPPRPDPEATDTSALIPRRLVVRRPGWNHAEIDRRLGPPDEHGRHPDFARGHRDTDLYRVERVEEVEAERAAEQAFHAVTGLVYDVDEMMMDEHGGGFVEPELEDAVLPWRDAVARLRPEQRRQMVETYRRVVDRLGRLLRTLEAAS